VGSNPARGCCVPTPTQRAILPGSVNEYERKLGSKRAYHAMHCFWEAVRSAILATARLLVRGRTLTKTKEKTDDVVTCEFTVAAEQQKKNENRQQNRNETERNGNATPCQSGVLIS